MALLRVSHPFISTFQINELKNERIKANKTAPKIKPVRSFSGARKNGKPCFFKIFTLPPFLSAILCNFLYVLILQIALKPFSQSIFKRDDEFKWIVNCLDRESSEIFNDILMNRLDKVEIKNKNKTFEVISKNMQTITYKNLIDSTYFSDSARIFKVNFLSPTSFKIDEKYTLFPNIEAIYKNLIRKFDSFSTEFSIYDEDMLESLIDNTEIIGYNLRSTVYHLESIKIPSYIGNICIKIHGTQQMTQIVKLLLTFAEYSGTGIKTALGMGAVKTDEVRKIARK